MEHIPEGRSVTVHQLTCRSGLGTPDNKEIPQPHYGHSGGAESSYGADGVESCSEEGLMFRYTLASTHMRYPAAKLTD